MFGKDQVKFKGLRAGIVQKIFNALKRREAEGGWIVVTIDEYNTSQKYSLCLSQVKIIKSPNFKGFGVLSCNTCKVVWQRDVNACFNMMTISLSVWAERERPAEFKYQKRNQSP